jgi:hypothetical protein
MNLKLYGMIQAHDLVDAGSAKCTKTKAVRVIDIYGMNEK